MLLSISRYFAVIFHTVTVCTSRHMVVCRVAQKAGAPHHEYIDRKNFHTYVAQRCETPILLNLLQKHPLGRQNYIPNLK